MPFFLASEGRNWEITPTIVDIAANVPNGINTILFLSSFINSLNFIIICFFDLRLYFAYPVPPQ